MIMRIAGVYPQESELNIKLDPDPEEPLGLEYILAIASKCGHDTRMFIPESGDDLQLVKDIIDYNPDVIAFSVLTKHIPRMIRLVSEIKKSKPSVKVVIGGPGASPCPEIIVQAPIDVCVIGEGEATFYHILDMLESGCNYERVKGIAYKDSSGRLMRTRERDRIADLDTLPLPIRSPRFYSINGYGLNYPPSSEMVYAPMVFSRGCPLRCSFCDSPKMWKKIVQFRSSVNTVREMLLLRDTYNVNYFFFEDLNFTINKDRVRALCEEMLRQKVGIFWACQTRADMVDADLLSLMKQAGCSKIAWGVESLSEKTLQNINKRWEVRQIAEALRMSSDLGIINWAFYIIGFPWENELDILSAAAGLASLDIHQLRVSIATPFPGSGWHKEFPPSALSPELSLYDTNHLVYDHPTISPERMKELQNEVFIRFYRSAKYRENVANMARKFPHLRKSFDEFLAYMDSNIELLKTGPKEITKVHKVHIEDHEEVCV